MLWPSGHKCVPPPGGEPRGVNLVLTIYMPVLRGAETGAKKLEIRDWTVVVAGIGVGVGRAGAGAKKWVMRDCRVPSLVMSTEDLLTIRNHRQRVEAEPERSLESEQ